MRERSARGRRLALAAAFPRRAGVRISRGLPGDLAPERIVWTYVFDPFPDAEALETLTLEERDGKTTVTTLTVHKTSQARDGHLSNGRMEAGMTEGYERLDELLAGVEGTLIAEEDTHMIDTPQDRADRRPADRHHPHHRSQSRDPHGHGAGDRGAEGHPRRPGDRPTGRWLTYHRKMNPETFDFEIGLPVNRPVADAGRVTNGQLPATTVARTIYHGRYEGLPTAWPELDAWIVAQGGRPAPRCGRPTSSTRR